jgi:hypothetical protein
LLLFQATLLRLALTLLALCEQIDTTVIKHLQAHPDLSSLVCVLTTPWVPTLLAKHLP